MQRENLAGEAWQDTRHDRPSSSGPSAALQVHGAHGQMQGSAWLEQRHLYSSAGKGAWAAACRSAALARPPAHLEPALAVGHAQQRLAQQVAHWRLAEGRLRGRAGGRVAVRV